MNHYEMVGLLQKGQRFQWRQRSHTVAKVQNCPAGTYITTTETTGLTRFYTWLGKTIPYTPCRMFWFADPTHEVVVFAGGGLILPGA